MLITKINGKTIFLWSQFLAQEWTSDMCRKRTQVLFKTTLTTSIEKDQWSRTMRVPIKLNKSFPLTQSRLGTWKNLSASSVTPYQPISRKKVASGRSSKSRNRSSSPSSRSSRRKKLLGMWKFRHSSAKWQTRMPLQTHHKTWHSF